VRVHAACSSTPPSRFLLPRLVSLTRYTHSLIHFFLLASIVLHQSSVPSFHNSRVCLSSRKISITSPTGTMSGRRTVTGRARIVRRARSQRVLPKVWLIDLYCLRFTYAVSFTSQGSLPCSLQVLQGRLLYRRGLMSLLPCK